MSKPATLKRGVGLVGVTMFGAGTAIGVSIFSVLQPAAEVAGEGLLIAVALAALPMVLFAICYAWLASAVPISGASYEWPRRFLGPFTGFAIAWLRILGNVGALVVLARVLTNYLGMAIDLPARPVMALALTLVFAFNYVGIGVAAWVQTALMLILIAVLAVFVGTGLPMVSAQLIGNPLGAGWGPALVAVPLMITLFLGIESAVEIGEEVRDAKRTIPLGILCAIILTAIIYTAVAATALGLVGASALAVSQAPLLDAARVPLGHLALPLIVGAATVSILKTMNATALIASRSLFAMGRSGVFPQPLAKIHPRFGTPHVAVLTFYVFALVGLALPKSLVFLLLAVNIPTMLKYLVCSLSAVQVATRHPEIAAQAHLKFRKSTIVITGWAAVIAAIVIILLGLGADVRPYLLVGAWFLCGCIYYALWRRRQPGPVASA